MADPTNFAYDYRFVCACGCELETDDVTALERFQALHVGCKTPEYEALTLLTRLVTAVESIVDHSKGR